MIKGIIFDMDGTILNTIDDISDSVNYALKKNNLPTKTLDEVKAAVGNGAFNLIKTVLPDPFQTTMFEDVYRDYQNYYDEHANEKTHVYPDILELLTTLKDQGYRCAVVSNKHRYLVEELNKQMFEDAFDVSMGMMEGVPIKPAPDMMEIVLKEMDLTREQVFFIGDSDVDILTAKNAKILSVGVTWGYRSQAVLEQSGADYLIHKPLELLEILKEVKKSGVN